ncbi:MAG: methyl-accepting chemotaxis protein [Deltaproteobacteria bacterium]|nr:methyl-accepting chemotaxis protein [Deltaproteobacteria bacterium]
MRERVRWWRTIGVRLGGSSLLLAGLSIALLGVNAVELTLLGRGGEWVDAAGRCRRDALHAATLAEMAATSARPADAARARAELRSTVTSLARRLPALPEGEGVMGIPGAPDDAVAERVRRIDARFRREVVPRVSAEREPSPAELHEASVRLRHISNDISRAVEMATEVGHLRSDRLVVLQGALAACALVILLVVTWLGRSVATRAGKLAETAQRIASGDLDLRADVSGTDELAALGSSFDAMTTSLRRSLRMEQDERRKVEALLATVQETATRLARSASSILAASSEQAAGAEEQAATVAETSATVHQVRQTAEQAAERARIVVGAAERSFALGRSGRVAVDEATTSMDAVREEVGTIATRVLMLAERAQAIGEIIATVAEIAERTNVLAVNAAIEAARAGDQAKGFSVVAAEVKALAGQSKRATAKVRQILGEIQNATHRAVLTTEQGSRRTGDALQVIGVAGGSIRDLASVLEDAATAVGQISASTSQQALGMTQIEQAMRNIDQVTRQNLTATRETQRQASALAELGTRLATQVGSSTPTR